MNQQINQEQRQRQLAAEQEEIRKRVQQIKHQVVVLSGKGGVGKSTVAANLALSLALEGKRVGLLDIDIHGPSIPAIMGLTNTKVTGDGKVILPVKFNEYLKVISIGFLLESQDTAVIWRGPMKYNAIKQFLKDVEWGTLDFLIVDSPPGTGDEPLSIIQLLEHADGALIVSTPQQLALLDVRKCITFCRQLNLPVLGVIENMSGFICPKCGEHVDIFSKGGAASMAAEMHVPFLGSIPIDPEIVVASDAGKPLISYYADSQTAKAFKHIIAPILKLDA